MPTHDPARALDVDEALGVVSAAVSGTAGRGLGLEVELFPVRLVHGRGQRVPIHGPDGSLSALGSSSELRLSLDAGETLGETGWCCLGAAGGRVGFEPGGQLEVSGRYHHRATDAVAAVDDVAALLARALDAAAIAPVAAGVDVWAPGQAAQQLAGPRYPAMAAALAARGPAGATMMRDTCALQLNLDLGTGAEAEARWLVTNLLAPAATATFACSPDRPVPGRSRRSLTWQAVDPTRTGFVTPAPEAGGDLPLAEHLARFALAADVLFVAAEEGTTPAPPGWRFSDWLRWGHPRHGRPTAADLRRHLSTLFPEVRPRGWLEIRSVDAVPAHWRPAVAALYLGAVYEPRARDRILEVLTARPAPLAARLHDAATRGLGAPSWCATAVEVWSYALEGATRLPASTVDRRHLDVAAAFLDQHTLRGRCPGDDLRDALRHGPAAALAWALEPGASRQELSR